MAMTLQSVSDFACPTCGEAIDTAAFKPLSVEGCPACAVSFTVPGRFESYRLNGVLGTGGSGVVYDAYDDQMQRRVAIKVLRNKGDEDKTALEAINEARALAQLSHPHIVAIHSLGEFEGHRYIEMGLLGGGSAKRHTSPKSRLSEQEAIDLSLVIADALRAAHQVGLLHLDVKPGNILYDEHDEAKLIDFGSAQHAKMRKNKKVVGTPYYIAPEIAQGDLPTFKSDLYSLGATMFHLLTGEPPFDAADSRGVIIKRLDEPAPDVRSVRPDIHIATAKVIAKMLATESDDRYASYDKLIKQLRIAKTALHKPIEPPTESTPPPAKKRRRRTPKKATTSLWISVLITMLIVGVIIGVILIGVLD